MIYNNEGKLIEKIEAIGARKYFYEYEFSNNLLVKAAHYQSVFNEPPIENKHYWDVKDLQGNEFLQLFANKIEVKWKTINSVEDQGQEKRNSYAFPNHFSNSALIKFHTGSPAKVML